MKIKFVLPRSLSNLQLRIKDWNLKYKVNFIETTSIPLTLRELILLFEEEINESVFISEHYKVINLPNPDYATWLVTSNEYCGVTSLEDLSNQTKKSSIFIKFENQGVPFREKLNEIKDWIIANPMPKKEIEQIIKVPQVLQRSKYYEYIQKIIDHHK